MGSITEYLNKIVTAVKGKDVRGAMHDAIKQVYDDAAKSGNANMEVTLARGTEPTLNDRLVKMDEIAETTTAELATLEKEKANADYVQTLINSVTGLGVTDVYYTFSALIEAYPSGTDGLFLVLDSDPSNPHKYAWSSSNSTWVDLGVYQWDRVPENSITTKELNVPFIKKYENIYRGIIRDNTNGLNTNQYMPFPQRNVIFGSEQKKLIPGYYIVCVDFALTAMDENLNVNLLPQLRNSDSLAIYSTTDYKAGYDRQYSSLNGIVSSKKVYQVLKITTEATYGVGLRAIGTANSANFTVKLNDAYIFRLTKADYLDSELATMINKYALTIVNNGYAEFYSELTVTEDFKSDLLKEVNGRITAVEDKIENNVKNITCWGDSLTRGVGATISYPSVLQALVGENVTVINMGVGGENSQTIAARQGGMPMIVDTFTIPAETTPVTITFKNYDKNIVTPGLQHGFIGVNPVTINGVEGNLSVSNGVYSFTRSTSGSTVDIDRPSAIITNAMRNNRDDIVVMWLGQNDGTNDATNIIRLEQLMVDYLTNVNKQYFIIGLSTINEEYRSPMEAQFLKAFGRRFINIRDYLSKYGMDDNGLKPTQTDISQMSVGQVPDSLRVDPTHLNDFGYASVAKAVHSRLLEFNAL